MKKTDKSKRPLKLIRNDKKQPTIWPSILDGISEFLLIVLGTIVGGILIIITLFLMTGCAGLGGGLPDTPKGDFCSHNAPKNQAICTSLDTGSAEASVPIASTDKWIMLSPKTWENIQNYIDALIRAVENSGSAGVFLEPTATTLASNDFDQTMMAGNKTNMVWVSVDDLKSIRDRVRWLKAKNQRQR